jgi:hypothetical protein
LLPMKVVIYHSTISWEPFNNSPRNHLKYKRITELGLNNDDTGSIYLLPCASK